MMPAREMVDRLCQMVEVRSENQPSAEMVTLMTVSDGRS